MDSFRIVATVGFIAVAFIGCSAAPDRGPRWTMSNCKDPEMVFLCEARSRPWGVPMWGPQ